jgi:hypothetical protein
MQASSLYFQITRVKRKFPPIDDVTILVLIPPLFTVALTNFIGAEVDQCIKPQLKTQVISVGERPTEDGQTISKNRLFFHQGWDTLYPRHR